MTNNKQFEINIYNESTEIFEAIYNHIETEFAEHDDFIVLDDVTKEEFTIERASQSLWAFNTTFIMNHLKTEVVADLSEYDRQELRKSIEQIQGSLCESANGLIKGLTEWKEMIENAIDIDGYGHFLNGYDFSENEFEYEGETYYIYYNN